MATFAARRLRDMSENTRGVLAVELLAAAQGLDFRAPLQPATAVAKAKAELREVVAYYDKDRFFGPDIEAATDLLLSASYNQYLPAGVLPSL